MPERFEQAIGESVTLAEHLVVAPSWGRVRLGAFLEGQEISPGMTIAHVDDAGFRMPVIASAAGCFLAWLAREGERVPPGRPLARLAFTEE